MLMLMLLLSLLLYLLSSSLLLSLSLSLLFIVAVVVVYRPLFFSNQITIFRKRSQIIRRHLSHESRQFLRRLCL